MTCQRIDPLNSDAGICDAARVSLAKLAANFTDEENAKLLKYLFTHKHWSPFGHAREIFSFLIGNQDWLYFLEHANTAGFTWYSVSLAGTAKRVFVSGSVWAWHENLAFFPEGVQDSVRIWFKSQPRYTTIAALLFRQPISFEKTFEYVPPHDVREFADLMTATFRITAPIFVARQLVKHQIDLCWNEESRRYIDSAPEFFIPEIWRSRPDKSIKQGSKDEDAFASVPDFRIEADNHAEHGHAMYDWLLQNNVAPELARMVLPQSALTQWIWTGTLKAFRRVCDLRLDAHAQVETRQIAQTIDTALRAYMPLAWKSLEESPEYIERG
jgi:thymidylate synthase (FAD)